MTIDALTGCKIVYLNTLSMIVQTVEKIIKVTIKKFVFWVVVIVLTQICLCSGDSVNANMSL